MIQAKSISKKFNRQTKNANYFYAVRGTTLTIQDGQLTAVFGKSGSGKTTLLNMLGGLLTPSEGKVYINGVDIYAMSDKDLSRFRNQNIGVIPQGSTGLQGLSVLENLLLPAMMYGKPGGDSEAYARGLLKTVGMSELETAMPNELSGGELRRMAIARALMMKPSLILADESTGDLDDENTEIVLRLLKQTAENGTAVLMVTHESGAENYADIIYRMNAGEISIQE